MLCVLDVKEDMDALADAIGQKRAAAWSSNRYSARFMAHHDHDKLYKLEAP